MSLTAKWTKTPTRGDLEKSEKENIFCCCLVLVVVVCKFFPGIGRNQA